MRRRGAAVAAIKKVTKNIDVTLPLQALTSAALVLPGLLSPTVNAAEGDEVDFQYSHYQEGKRNILSSNPSDLSVIGQKNANPIEVESLHGSAKVSLTDRVKFAFNYLQDTWGGATPISTGLASSGFNSAIALADGKTISGASPYIQTPNASFLTLFDRNYKPYSTNLLTGRSVADNRLTHVMATASPETRKQGDFKLTYEWDEAALSVGGGISLEDDYESRFGNINGRWDLNQKRTTLNLGLSYTNSQTNAIINHDTISYINQDNYFLDHLSVNTTNDANSLTGNREDWGATFGVTQILDKDALIGADVAYTRSIGYMSNPYKLTEVVFVNPQDFLSSDFAPINAVGAFLERRPEARNQWDLGGRYVQYLNGLDAALHFDYHFSADDWGIQAHTFEADWVQPVANGWSITPRIRYYSQDAADFYHPYLLIKEPIKTVNANGNVVNANSLPSNFSSDQRLSGFGALSGGVTVNKQFAKGLSLETGFEYYTHQGGLKIGGGGEGAYADFDYWVANAALKVDLGALSLGGGIGASHAGHEHHQGANAPAGVMFSHMLPKAGDFMVGYRYLYGNQSGDMLHGTDPANDQSLVANGCSPNPCFLATSNMAMHMHMLDLMYAPTDWLTLMLMPQFMDMNMSMRGLNGAPSENIADNNVGNPLDPRTGAPLAIGQHIPHHVQNGHETGGIGDLSMYAMFKLFDNGIHHVHITPGFSAPTGDVDIQLQRNHQVNGGFIHYGMQLGSGTWDFKPSLTYTGHVDEFSWGAQANGTVRMGDKNKSGYALGDIFQATAWGGII